MGTMEDWVEPEEEDETGYPIDYNITSSPNDFNVKTLFDFIESGTVTIGIIFMNSIMLILISKHPQVIGIVV